eukprot:scaffold10173_cov281-Chaetoceros_neogracile.AAC.10
MTNECLNQPQPQDPTPRLQAGGGVVTRTTACDLFVHLLVLNRGTTACDLRVVCPSRGLILIEFMTGSIRPSTSRMGDYFDFLTSCCDLRRQ